MGFFCGGRAPVMLLPSDVLSDAADCRICKKLAQLHGNVHGKIRRMFLTFSATQAAMS